MYVIYEYAVSIAMALVLGGVLFVASLIVLVSQEGGRRLAAGSRAIYQHASKLVDQYRRTAKLLPGPTHQESH